MLALAHVPIQSQERNHNQIVQRPPPPPQSTNQLKQTRSFPRQTSSSGSPHTHSHTRSPALQPRDHPAKAQIKSTPASTSSVSNSISISAFPVDPFQPFDVNTLPPAELLPLLASLLQEIALANDHLHTSDNRQHLKQDISQPCQSWNSLTAAAKESLSTPSSTLSFHARHAPSISLEAYLLRILKYCPTSNEVFLSLLIYFDRMTKLSILATGKDFVIDSYNIHRLVIAGVTVASKFFSDVFYTNSRYAKVGGLPQAELNQLELQFLLLNDFNLVIPVEEMQRYASQLIAYSRESKNFPSSPLSDKPPISPLTPGTTQSTASSVGSVLNSVAAVQQQQNIAELDGSYDTEDETICPSHSSGASETSSIYTVRNGDEDNGRD